MRVSILGCTDPPYSFPRQLHDFCKCHHQCSLSIESHCHMSGARSTEVTVASAVPKSHGYTAKASARRCLALDNLLRAIRGSTRVPLAENQTDKPSCGRAECRPSRSAPTH